MSPRIVRALSRAMLGLFLVLIVVLTSFSQALSSDDCARPPDYFALFRGQQFAGTFRVALGLPDYHSTDAVQRHLVFASTWAQVLSSELSRQSRGVCGAQIVPFAFPDLRVLLFVNGSADQAQSRSCARTFQDILLHSLASDESIRAAASVQMRGLSLQRSNPVGGDQSDAENILSAALPAIYSRESVLHALTSIDVSSYQSLDFAKFRDWVQDRRTSQDFDFIPVSACQLQRDQNVVPANAATVRLRNASAIAPPGEIKVARGASGPASTGTLRHVLIVGNADGPTNPWITTAATTKYCDQQRLLDVVDGLGRLVTRPFRIHCLRETVYDLDSWLVMYCEPLDCTSEADEQAVIAAVARDPDVLKHALGEARAEPPRGPYNVTVAPVP